MEKETNNYLAPLAYCIEVDARSVFMDSVETVYGNTGETMSEEYEEQDW